MKASVVWAIAALSVATAASGQESHKAPTAEHKAPAQEHKASAQEHKASAHEAQKAPAQGAPATTADSGRTKHGIVLRRQPKATPPKTETTEEVQGPTKGAPEVVKIAPSVSPERVATAIAEAIRSAESKRPTSSTRAHTVRHSPPRVPQRRYTVRWPSERFEVEWPEPENRVKLAWSADAK